MGDAGAEVVDRLRRSGVRSGDPVALAVAPHVGVGLAVGEWPAAPGPGAVSLGVASEDPVAVVRAVEETLAPRWVMWSGETAATLVAGGLRVVRCWDVAAVQRLLAGGWRADPARVWAELHDLDPATAAAAGPLDLFSQADDGSDDDGPVRADGHLRAAWVSGGWAADRERLRRWAELAHAAAGIQQARLTRLATDEDRPAAPATALSESAAELLCAEMSADGLPMDRAAAEAIVAAVVGPRPRSEAEAAEQRARRDAEVLRHVPPPAAFDLRSPGQVRSLLRRVGVEVPDTRAWRLEAVRDAHPAVEALLAWRKAERVATTFGYGWIDEHLGADGRLRGAWSGSDGAAGRMTASAGLHNMPADMRGAVVAEPGHVFVRADLGQIEPRVLAAVSGDAALARATGDDDMYAPIAAQLGVDRPTAKVAVLGAMYGQTTGHGAQALRRLHAAYPVAMAYLDGADRSGRAGLDIRTHGGRLIRLRTPGADLGEREARGRAAAQGRYGRNALVQGAAAEMFKMWAALVRARAAPLGARIELCLHDELLVHAPSDRGDAVAGLLEACLQETAQRWAPGGAVRFVADIGVIIRWSDAKE
jgi:DNA polymerase-1